MSASGVNIEDDGTAGNNNWAKDNDSNGQIDTSHMVGTASTTDGSVSNISAPSGDQGTTVGNDVAANQAVANDVTKYTLSVANPVTGRQSYTFTFQRKVSGTTVTP